MKIYTSGKEKHMDTTIGVTIKDRAAEIEELGTLPEDILQIIYEEKLFKLFVPIELGGRMLDLPDAVRIFQDAAMMDGSFGWLVTIGSGGNMFAPNMDETTCETLFSQQKAVIAGSGYPTGVAVKTTDGYVVSGEWKYCSGAQFASFFTANCFIEENGKRTNTIISCIFMPEQVEIVADWNAFGLKGTGSHTIKVNQAFIPYSHTFHLGVQRNNYGYAVHSFPFLQFSEASFVAVCLGIGADFLREATNCAMRKQLVWSQAESNRYKLVMTNIQEQEKIFAQAVHIFYSTLEEIWHIHTEQKEIKEEDLQQFSLVCKNSATIAIQCANTLIRYLGMEAVMESSALNRIWRNLYTAGQHAFLTPS